MWKLSAATSRSASSTNIYIKLNWRPAQHSGEFNLIFPLKLLIYLTFLIVLVFLEILFSTISIFWLDCLRIWRKIKSWVLNKSKQWNFTMADFIQIRPDFYFKWKICSYVSLKCLLSATTNWAKCTYVDIYFCHFKNKKNLSQSKTCRDFIHGILRRSDIWWVKSH